MDGFCKSGGQRRQKERRQSRDSESGRTESKHTVHHIREFSRASPALRGISPENQINQHASDGNIKPYRKSPAGNASVKPKLAGKRIPKRGKDHRKRHHGQSDMADEDG